MSTIRDAIDGIRKVLLLTDQVKANAQTMKTIAGELRDHERRLIRIETMIEMSVANRTLPPSGAE